MGGAVLRNPLFKPKSFNTMLKTSSSALHFTQTKRLLFATMERVLQLLFAASVIYLSSSTANDGPLIHTKLGALRGQYTRVRGKPTAVHSYLGLPFAKPPVGPLRLARPQPVQGWEGVRDATKQPYMCLQDRHASVALAKVLSLVVEIPEVSEDCLYLNIYTPAKPAEDAKLPVMVWIHGGAFVLGSASFYDGSVLAAYQNVVVVQIQYRLSLLGFFSTGDENAPGNMGFLDQQAALQWVQENIQSFGGDPSSVTIFGESVGGVSVSLQVLSPLSAGLFHRAIAQSGTAFMEVMTKHKPMDTAMTVANVANCVGTKPHQIVDCVMQMSTEDILKVVGSTSWIWGLTNNDDYFMPKNIEDTYESLKFNKVPLIHGVTTDESGSLLPSFHTPPDWTEGMDRATVKTLITGFIRNTEDWVVDLILDDYLGSGEDRIKNRDGFREVMADMAFIVPAIHTSNAHRDSGVPVYQYELQHAPSVLLDKRPSFVRVDHGDDLILVFGSTFMRSHVKMEGTFTEEEDELTRTIMSYWGNFARTGSPNGPGLTHWPMYGAGEEYLEIGLKQQLGKHLGADRLTYWTETLPKKILEKQQQRSDEL